jgi:hypothetical protein
MFLSITLSRHMFSFLLNALEVECTQNPALFLQLFESNYSINRTDQVHKNKGPPHFGFGQISQYMMKATQSTVLNESTEDSC